LKTIDKAAWQIDAGVSPDVVVAHFNKIFKWLDAKGMLTDEGQELMELGIDQSVSLHERLVTENALGYLESRYDDYISQYPYGTDLDAVKFEELFVAFENNPK
jgi:hypothetical protein